MALSAGARSGGVPSGGATRARVRATVAGQPYLTLTLTAVLGEDPDMPLHTVDVAVQRLELLANISIDPLTCDVSSPVETNVSRS